MAGHFHCIIAEQLSFELKFLPATEFMLYTSQNKTVSFVVRYATVMA